MARITVSGTPSRAPSSLSAEDSVSSPSVELLEHDGDELIGRTDLG